MQIKCLQSFSASARCARSCKIVTHCYLARRFRFISYSIYWKAENLITRSLTWSYYANNKAVKYLIAIIPHDTICSILKGWGTHTSYQHITENPGFSKYLSFADTVIADCWFDIASRGCWYVHSWNPPPTLLKGGWDLLKISSPGL